MDKKVSGLPLEDLRSRLADAEVKPRQELSII
jgi:hypothetical protein